MNDSFTPLRIMHISTRLILGGSQENTVLSCEGQADMGHDVSIVFGPIFGPEGSMLKRVEDHPGIGVFETPRLMRELSPLKDIGCVKDLQAIIRKWKPDVVHTHSSKAGILGRVAAWREKVPCVIHTIHGLAFHPYGAWWRNKIYIRAEKMAARHCHRIACVAEAMRDQALAAGIGHREQYAIVRSGMEVEAFVNPASVNPSWTRDKVRSELGFDDGDVVIGTIARLAELKGHDDVIDAFEPLLRARPELKLLWVGDGWHRERLEGRLASIGMSDRVVRTGLVPPGDIPKYLAAMDVLCHPSYREGLPRTVTQALLSGVPVMAYDVDGTREVCIDGETGHLLKPGDITGLRESAQWMMDHPAERIRFGERGRERCRVDFAAATMVDGLEKLYRSVLSSSQ